MNQKITIKVNGEYVNVCDGDTVEVSPPVLINPNNTSLSPSTTKAVEAIVSDLIISTIEVSGPTTNRMISAEDAAAISIKHDRKANQAIIRLIQQAELRGRIDELNKWVEYLEVDNEEEKAIKDHDYICEELRETMAQHRDELKQLEANDPTN